MRYRVTLTPSQPYFFGNDKRFAYTGESKPDASYFILSEAFPAQTSLLGALRYLLLPHKGFGLPEAQRAENARVIGPASFDVDRGADEPPAPAGSFGCIRSISPLFLTERATGRRLIHIPLDHKGGSAYAPFSDLVPIETSEGAKLYAEDYSAKDGLSDAWLCVEDGAVTAHSDLFAPVIRVSVNLHAQKEGFFKRQFMQLNKAYAFAFDAELADEAAALLGTGKTLRDVLLFGQCGTPFTAVIEPAPAGQDILRDACERLRTLRDAAGAWPHAVYCASDLFVTELPYQGTLFAAIGTRDHRAFRTMANGMVDQGKLRRLVSAGSIFLFANEQAAADWCQRHNNAYVRQAGMNCLVYIKKGE